MRVTHPLVGQTTVDVEDHRITVLRVASKRVFKMRIWLGLLILKFGFWVSGSTAEAVE